MKQVIFGFHLGYSNIQPILIVNKFIPGGVSNGALHSENGFLSFAKRQNLKIGIKQWASYSELKAKLFGVNPEVLDACIRYQPERSYVENI